MTRRTYAAGAMAACVVWTSACATDGLASLPLPAPGLDSAAYSITAVFSSALNLPARAKVKMGGADIGEVDSMSTANYTAVTILKIRSDAVIPKGSTAELRSATPLGDIFVAIKPPLDADARTPLLRNGDTIGIESTMAAATIEAVLSSAAVVVNGGAVRNLTNTINGVGRATGPNGEAFGNLVAQSNQLLGTLNNRSDQLDAALRQISQLATEIDGQHVEIADLLAAAGPATDTLATNSAQIADLADQVGAVAVQLSKFPSIAGTDKESRSVFADVNALSKSLNDVVLSPNVSLRDLNRLLPSVLKSLSSSNVRGKGSIDQLALGSIPDIGYQGDPGFHGPKRYDWAKLVGSLKYQLWRLQERVVGQGPDADQPPMHPSLTEPGVIEPVLPSPAAAPASEVPGQGR